MHSQRFSFNHILSILALCIVLSGTSWAEDHEKPDNGYNCVLMGHSFFVPMARQLEEHAKRYGFEDHQQVVSGAGGDKGSPGELWKNLDRTINSREAIRSGSVNLVGLTAAGIGSELVDYKRWVDFALEHNPHTSFFIMAPSSRYQDKSFKVFEVAWKNTHAKIHGLIDALRKDYPETTFFCIPQGQVKVELWRHFEQGKLPEVAELKSREKPSIFRDNTGHGGEVIIKTGTLLWLASIYDADLEQYEWDPETKTDLKALAQKIAQGDPYTKH